MPRFRLGHSVSTPAPARTFARSTAPTCSARCVYSTSWSAWERGTWRRIEPARDKALAWLIRYPVQNNLWDGYFEDIAIAQPGENPNQYTPLETARYLMHHPEVDPEWRAHVANLLKWVTGLFTVDVSQNVFEPGRQFGAEILSEQRSDMAKMASHTARFASILALFYEKTGDADSRRRAFRSFNWATYACADNGVVTVSPNPREGYWFSDGYGDYIRHFIAGMASVPVWAPTGENHILRSTSVMVELSVTADRVAYTAFDADGDEVLRLAKAPMSIAMGGKECPADRQRAAGHSDGARGCGLENQTARGKECGGLTGNAPTCGLSDALIASRLHDVPLGPGHRFR